MKNKVKFRSWAIALSSIAGLSAISTIALTSCNDKSSNTGAKATAVMTSGEANAAYHTVTFTKGDYTEAKLIGKTKVSVKENYPFGTVVPPKVIIDGYSLTGWALSTSPTTVITQTTPVADDMTVVPVLQQIESTVEITGDDVLYDGFNEAHLYTATIEGPGSLANLVWTIEDSVGTELDVATIEDVEDGQINVIPKFTETKIDAFVVARLGSGVGVPEAKLPITIYPPYYRSGEVELEYESTTYTLDTGNAYWVHGDDLEGSDDLWIGIPADSVCSEDAALEWYIWEWPTTPVSALYVEMPRASMDEENWMLDVYPGSEMYRIDDYCLANIAHFNGELHGGVDVYGEEKVINQIGDHFLEDCISFNQNINDLFNIPVGSGLSIGDSFLSGCSAFNNGTTDGSATTFTFPHATHIGDSFMDECVAFNPSNLTLWSGTWYIGEFFMNGCDALTNITIPSTCTDVLQFVGAYFLTDCTALRSVTVDTADIQYFADLYAEGSDKGSFTWFGDITAYADININVYGASAQELIKQYPVVDHAADPGIPGDVGYCRHLVIPAP